MESVAIYRRLTAVAVTSVLLTGVVGVVGATSSDAASGASRIVVTSTVARTQPAASARATARLDRMERVVVTAKRAGWAKTNVGWVPTKALSTGNRYADNVAAEHGLRVQYTNNQACGVRASVNTADEFDASGCYVDGSPTIQLTKSAAYDGTAAWKRNAIHDLVLHEATHARIYALTGRAHPQLAGARAEQVTDAYAWKYLGASRAAGGYGFTKADLAKATKIHSMGR
jgi:hypothetical protein